jgi:hypothetical protein
VRDVFTPLVGIAGFVAGLLLWTQLTRWAVLLHASVVKQGGDFLGPPKRRLLWVIPFVALLHPAPWLIGVAGIFAFRAFRSDAGGGGTWFFGGLSAALLFMAVTTVTLLARWRRFQRSRAGGPNT